MRLRVSSIDPTINKLRLQEIFEEYGDVVSVKIFRSVDGKTPTLGFIEMKREKEAEKALKAVNGQVLGETPIKVEYTTDRVTSHKKPLPVPILDDDDDDDDVGIDDDLDEDFDEEEEEEGKIKEIPLDELDEEI